MPSVLADFVNGADVGMVESGSRTRFPAESFKRLRVIGDIFGQELQRHEAAEFSVLSLVNNSHAATAEFLDDAVMRDHLADHWSRILRLGRGQVNESDGMVTSPKCCCRDIAIRSAVSKTGVWSVISTCFP